MNPWKLMNTSEKIEAIKAVWRNGMSAKMIAATIPGQPSRNSIIGMYTRYPGKLEGHPLRMASQELGKLRKNRTHSPALKSMSIVAARKQGGIRGGKIAANMLKMVAPVVVATPRPIEALFGAPEPLNLTLMELTNHTCKWAVNEPEKGGVHLFCGHETNIGDSWCPYHHVRVFGQGTESERSAHRALARAA